MEVKQQSETDTTGTTVGTRLIFYYMEDKKRRLAGLQSLN